MESASEKVAYINSLFCLRNIYRIAFGLGKFVKNAMKYPMMPAVRNGLRGMTGAGRWMMTVLFPQYNGSVANWANAKWRPGPLYIFHPVFREFI